MTSNQDDNATAIKATIKTLSQLIILLAQLYALGIRLLVAINCTLLYHRNWIKSQYEYSSPKFSRKKSKRTRAQLLRLNNMYVKTTIHVKMQQIGIKNLSTRKGEKLTTSGTTTQMYCRNHVVVATSSSTTVLVCRTMNFGGRTKRRANSTCFRRIHDQSK